METSMPPGPAGGPLTPAPILETATAFFGSKVLITAVQLGVFAELGEGPATGERLRERLGISDRASADFFDALVALGFLEREDGRYSNADVSARFLDPAQPTYLGAFLTLMGDRQYGLWGRLPEAVRSGRPVSEEAASETDVFEAFSDAQLREFMYAMDASSGLMGMGLAHAFPWAGHATFADIGGAIGGISAALVGVHPHLTGVCFDQPRVGPIFTDRAAERGVTGKVRFQGGDFFTDTLPEADVLILGHVLADWNLEQKRTLIKKAYDAVRPGGALLVYDGMIADDRSGPLFGLMLSLNMLLDTGGGFMYTSGDCEKWLRDAGFTETSVSPFAGTDTLIVARKADR